MQHGLYMVSGAGALYHLDAASGSARLIGSVGIPNVTDIAFQGPTLWGLTFTQFLRIDSRTGAGTIIGSTGHTDLNGLAVSSAGVIYAAGSVGNSLVRIDPVTAQAAVIGPLGPYTSSGDLAFDSNDVLYAALNSGGTVVLATVHPTTGAATTIGPIEFPTCYGLAFHGGRLYGATDAGEVLQINCATGAGTIIGRNGQQQFGLAAACSC